MPAAEQKKIKALQEKILLARESGEESTVTPSAHNGANYAWRMVLELVIGLVLGFGIGYGLDYWLGTAPIMIMIMSLFGFGAGVKTMMNTASEYSKIESEFKKEEHKFFEGK